MLSTAVCPGESLWRAFGLPDPQLSGYDYERENGVVRTAFDSGLVRQRRRRPRGRRVYRLAWRIEAHNLPTLELFLAQYGGEWFQCPIHDDAIAELRLTGAARVSFLSGNLAEVAVSAEGQPTD